MTEGFVWLLSKMTTCVFCLINLKIEKKSETGEGMIFDCCYVILLTLNIGLGLKIEVKYV